MASMSASEDLLACPFEMLGAPAETVECQRYFRPHSVSIYDLQQTLEPLLDRLIERSEIVFVNLILPISASARTAMNAHPPIGPRLNEHARSPTQGRRALSFSNGIVM